MRDKYKLDVLKQNLLIQQHLPVCKTLLEKPSNHLGVMYSKEGRQSTIGARPQKMVQKLFLSIQNGVRSLLCQSHIEDKKIAAQVLSVLQT